MSAGIGQWPLGVMSPRILQPDGPTACRQGFRKRRNFVRRSERRGVPRTDICSAAKSTLLNHLVGTAEQQFWKDDVERSRSFEIDNQFYLHRQLHRKVS